MESPGHCDYALRQVVPKQVFAQVMFEAVMAIDWRNMKGESLRHTDETGADYSDALHDVWSVLRRLQR